MNMRCRPAPGTFDVKGPGRARPTSDTGGSLSRGIPLESCWRAASHIRRGLPCTLCSLRGGVLFFGGRGSMCEHREAGVRDQGSGSRGNEAHVLGERRQPSFLPDGLLNGKFVYSVPKVRELGHMRAPGSIVSSVQSRNRQSCHAFR